MTRPGRDGPRVLLGLPRGPKARARSQRNKAPQILSTFCELRIGYFCSTGPGEVRAHKKFERLALKPCGRGQNR